MTGESESLKPKATARKGEIVEIEVKVPIPVDETAEELFENRGDGDEP